MPPDKRLVVVVPNEVAAQSRRGSNSDDDAWRSYLENPLTAATKAMMSINGDEDSAAALSLLYDFYKVPRERRQVSSGVKPTAVSASGPDSCGGPEMLDHHLQALRSMPVNLSLNSSNAEHQGSKYSSPYPTGQSRGGDGKGGGGLPLVKTESAMSVGVACSGAAFQEEPIRIVYGQSDFPLAGFLKNEQRSAPDSTNDSSAGEYYVSKLMVFSPRGSQMCSCYFSDGFRYSLEASMSLRPRQGEGPMAYLNRGQFYPLMLSMSDFPSSVTSIVIMVVFGEDKCRDEQLKNWKYWHSRQHTAKQRVLDIADYKESFSTIGNVEEIAYNAVSFTWDIREEAKVFISVNCLSTDFSSQKGVKGMPLIIQIDTYSYNSGSGSRPIHRAFAQMKVFCDKGAERKLRDEEKKQLRRRTKGKNSTIGQTSPIKRADSTLLKPVTDLDSQPVLFIPDVYFGNLQRAGQVNTLESVLVKRMSCEEDACLPPSKKFLLYVRKECDEVFDALMLHSPTLKALMEAISEKYSVPVDKAKVYQKSKKGVLVNMDDNIIQQYSNEDTFILGIESAADSFRVTLSEI
uniref:Grh/CP2 DB domain-containing protein n=1 Tax=Takifugu rubripes TaxID=31033 RepID=H2TZV2_TAKRU